MRKKFWKKYRGDRILVKSGLGRNLVLSSNFVAGLTRKGRCEICLGYCTGDQYRAILEMLRLEFRFQYRFASRRGLFLGGKSISGSSIVVRELMTS